MISYEMQRFYFLYEAGERSGQFMAKPVVSPVGSIKGTKPEISPWHRKKLQRLTTRYQFVLNTWSTAFESGPLNECVSHLPVHSRQRNDMEQLLCCALRCCQMDPPVRYYTISTIRKGRTGNKIWPWQFPFELAHHAKQRCCVNNSCVFSSSKNGTVVGLFAHCHLTPAAWPQVVKEDHYEINISHNRVAECASILAHSQTMRETTT